MSSCLHKIFVMQTVQSTYSEVAANSHQLDFAPKLGWACRVCHPSVSATDASAKFKFCMFS